MSSKSDPRPCTFGVFAIGVLTGVAVCFITMFITARKEFHGPDAGAESIVLFFAISLIGPSISAVLALISLIRRERPIWPSIFCIAVALCPLGLWGNHLIYIHNFK